VQRFLQQLRCVGIECCIDGALCLTKEENRYYITAPGEPVTDQLLLQRHRVEHHGEATCRFEEGSARCDVCIEMGNKICGREWSLGCWFCAKNGHSCTYSVQGGVTRTAQGRARLELRKLDTARYCPDEGNNNNLSRVHLNNFRNTFPYVSLIGDSPLRTPPQPSHAQASGSQPTHTQASSSHPTSAQASGSQPTRTQASGSRPMHAQASGSQPTRTQPSRSQLRPEYEEDAIEEFEDDEDVRVRRGRL